MVGDGAGDRLANPPCRVGAEFVAAAVFVFIDRPHQAGVAFLDDVQKAQAAVAVFFGDGNHQPQVAAGQLSLGLFVLRKDRLDRPQTLIKLTRRFKDKVLHAVEFLLHRVNILGHIIAIRAGLNDLLKLMHLLANALQLFHHRLNAAGPQAQFFQQRRDLAAIAVNLLDSALLPR